jgi:hypothetical protein
MLEKPKNNLFFFQTKNSLLLFLMLLFLGCGNQFNFKKNSNLIFEESYYESWVAGVKGGGSGWNIYLTLEKKLKKNLQIEGIYFKQHYCKLNDQKENKYLGHILTSQNRGSNSVKTSEVTDENETTKIPFILEGNDAVLVYFENKKRRYLKLTLREKEMKFLPM